MLQADKQAKKQLVVASVCASVTSRESTHTSKRTQTNVRTGTDEQAKAKQKRNLFLENSVGEQSSISCVVNRASTFSSVLLRVLIVKPEKKNVYTSTTLSVGKHIFLELRPLTNVESHCRSLNLLPYMF